MNSSLRDQLLRLGLATEKQARQAQQQEQQRQHRERTRSAPAASAAAPAGREVQTLKQTRDQELNQRRQDKAQRKARLAEIQQLVEQHRLPRLETDDHYSFIDGRKVRRMSVDAQRRAQLMSGALTIVRYKGHYAVVPAEIGARIRQREEQMVVAHMKPQASVPQDDAYKDFVVPDDLMW